MYGKKQWVGTEVEGRYTGLKTFFVRELNDSGTLNLVGPDYRGYPHYYFCIDYMRKCKEGSQELKIIRDILDNTNKAVTIEAMSDTLKGLAPDLVNRCHIIYRIHDDALQLLKSTDTLSIDAGWYRVHQITKTNMMETTPDMYIGDEEV